MTAPVAIDQRTAYLIHHVRRAYALGYNIEPGWVWWNTERKGGAGSKDISGLRKGWQHLGRLPLAEIERRILAGEANGYLVHGSTSCPQVGGVTLLDGDTNEECARISLALGGAQPNVHSGSGWWHWYVRGVVRSSTALKTKDTAFGPGTWYIGPTGMRVYTGELPDPATLGTVLAPPTEATAAPAPAPVAGFFQPVKSIDSAARQWARLGDRVVGFVRRCEMFGWGGDAHGQLLEMTRELAQLAPDHAHRALGEWFAAGGAAYVDDRVWMMLDSALGKYPADKIAAPPTTEQAGTELGQPVGATMNPAPPTADRRTYVGEPVSGGGPTPGAVVQHGHAAHQGPDRPADASIPGADQHEHQGERAAPKRLPMIGDAVWDAYGWTRSIRAQARAADVCPDAVLGAMLASYASQVPPGVRIVTGTKMPLGANLVVSLVGPSGSDKSTAFNLAQRIMPGSAVPVINNPGSGEAFAASFVHPDPDFDGPAKSRPKVLKPDPRALFYVAEGALLGSVGARLGSTWLPHLRSLAVDESLSTTNATAEINRQVPAMSYRAGVVVGFQVTTAAFVLHDTGTGTAQRFLWFTSLSSEARGLPMDAADVPMATPVLTRLGAGIDEHNEPIHYIAVTQSITERIRAEQEHVRLTRDIAATDDHDAHRHTLVAKLAALAVLADGRVMIDEGDWLWAEALYAASAATRDVLLELAEDKAAEERSVAGQHMAVTDRARRNHDGDEARVAQIILNRLDRVGVAGRRELRDAVPSRYRRLFSGALDQLESAGWVVRDANGKFYRGSRNTGQ